MDAVHDCSSGGLGVALAEMAISGGLGARVDLARRPERAAAGPWRPPSRSLTGGSSSPAADGRRSPPPQRSGVPHAIVGKVGGASLSLAAGRSLLANVPVSSMRSTWEGAIPELMD